MTVTVFARPGRIYRVPVGDSNVGRFLARNIDCQSPPYCPASSLWKVLDHERALSMSRLRAAWAAAAALAWRLLNHARAFRRASDRSVSKILFVRPCSVADLRESGVVSALVPPFLLCLKDVADDVVAVTFAPPYLGHTARCGDSIIAAGKQLDILPVA